MNITEIRALRGPNFYSQQPVILLSLHVEELEYQPTSSRADFKEKIEALIPTLYEHRNTHGEEGAFLEQLDVGASVARVVEHVALELQRLIGHDVSFSKTKPLQDKGHYHVAYQYINEEVGLRSAQMALDIVQALYEGAVVDLSEHLSELRDTETNYPYEPLKESHIPICAITGTNGKTTTTRLIAHILQIVGHKVGLTSTDHVSIDGIPILKGDYSGPGGAKEVMKDPRVDVAVLEVARGGILRRGLGFPSCDVGVLLNVTSDHLGLGGIDTLEDLALVKSTVTESVKKNGWAVFNADDQETQQVINRTQAKTLLFSRDSHHPLLKNNLEAGFINVTLEDGHILLQLPEKTIQVIDIEHIPISFGGRAMFNVDNAMAATAASYALGVELEYIREGLRSFQPSFKHSAGRLNLVDLGPFHVLIDYGHNVAAIRALAEFLNAFPAKRVIRMAAGVGDRKTEDLYEFGLASAVPGDLFFLSDPSPRGRALGETPEIIRHALISRGVAPENIHLEYREVDATRRALEAAEPGDLVVLQIENVQRVTQDVLDFKEKIERETMYDRPHGSKKGSHYDHRIYPLGLKT